MCAAAAGRTYWFNVRRWHCGLLGNRRPPSPLSFPSRGLCNQGSGTHQQPGGWTQHCGASLIRTLCLLSHLPPPYLTAHRFNCKLYKWESLPGRQIKKDKKRKRGRWYLYPHIVHDFAQADFKLPFKQWQSSLLALCQKCAWLSKKEGLSTVNCVCFTVKYRWQIYRVCDGGKIAFALARESWQTNQKGLLTATQSPLLTFPLIYGLAEGLLCLWNGWHSAPKISLPGYESVLAFGLASFTAQCAQLGRLDCETPSFVSTSAMRHKRIISAAAVHTVWETVLPVIFGFMTLAFQFALKVSQKNKIAHIGLN